MRRSTVTRGWLLAAPAVGFLAIFFVGSLLVNLAESLRGPEQWLQLAAYRRALGDAYYLTVLAQTSLLSVAVTIVTLALGYPLAVAIARSTGLVKSLLIFLVVTPLLINVVVRTFGWMVVLGRSGLLNSLLRGLGIAPLDIGNGWLAILIALVHVLLPFMVLSIASSLEAIDASLEEAATTLGASPFRNFLHVVLPLSLEGVATGTLLVFSLAMGSFVTAMLMGSNSTMVLPLLVYQQLTVASDWPFAAALGTVLLAVVTLATVAQLAVVRRLQHR